MKVSVIVCTHNRAYAIGPCLDSIAQALANAAPVAAEIVVVDNASTDDTSAVVREWAKTSAFPVNIQFESRKGLANARNCGIRAARGDLLVWTDDDCRLDKDHISDALRHDAADIEPVLRGGRVELGDPTDLPMSIKTDLTPARWSRQMGSAKRVSLGYCIAGCNMIMRRTLVERLGPFDWRFSTKAIPAAEDTDYIFRAYLAGLTIEYVPDAVVFHFHGRKTISDKNKLMRNYMIGKGAVYAKHFFRDPNLCRPAFFHFWLALKEIIFGRNNYKPDVEFRKFAAYYIMGAMRYCATFLKRPQ
jgi:glycosyltransferase involved in cell wall biosynthesis